MANSTASDWLTLPATIRPRPPRLTSLSTLCSAPPMTISRLVFATSIGRPRVEDDATGHVDGRVDFKDVVAAFTNHNDRVDVANLVFIPESTVEEDI